MERLGGGKQSRGKYLKNLFYKVGEKTKKDFTFFLLRLPGEA